MLTTLNTKLLVAILAAITAIGSIVAYDHHKTVQAAEILQKQQQEADKQRKEQEDFDKKVAKEQKRFNANPGNESDTWDKYIP